MLKSTIIISITVVFTLDIISPNVLAQTITQWIKNTTGLGLDNIRDYLVDKEDFRLFKNNNEFQSYYSSDNVEFDTFDIVLNPDDYYVILPNTYSSFSTKTVQLLVSGFC